MGNNQSEALKSIPNSSQSQISHIKREWNKTSTKNKSISADNFIINFHKTYGGNKLDDTQLNDKRRIVFVSLIGLFKSYKQCPSHVLYTCLLVLPLKKKWIYNPNRYQRELQQQFNGMADDIFNKNDKQSKEKRMDFIRLLQWKDRQGFAFWMLDGHEYKYKNKKKTNENEMIAPFWRHFSNTLTSIYDPVTDKKCKPLHLDEAYWRDEFDETVSKYKTTRKQIYIELFLVTMKYATIQQIIYESNPESLNPIICYDPSNINKEDESKKDETPDHVKDDGFWISSDYICDSSHGDIEYIHAEINNDGDDTDASNDDNDEDEEQTNIESYVLSEEPDTPEEYEPDLSSFKGSTKL